MFFENDALKNRIELFFTKFKPTIIHMILEINSSINSIFQQFFAGVNKIFILGRELAYNFKL